MKSINSVQGWALDMAVELDRYVIGFAGHFLRASDERRQVLAAYFAMSEPSIAESENPALAEQADMLVTATHHRILAAAYASVPAGMRGALARSGGQPHERQFYIKLHRLLACPPHAGFKAALGQASKLNLAQLKILERLPERCCSARLAEVMGTVEYAERATALTALLAQHGVDRDALNSALATVESHDQLRRFWHRWALKAKFPEHPVPEGPYYRPVGNGAELTAMALGLRNCSERYLARIFEGRSAFAETGEGKSRAVVHLKHVRGQWLADFVYGPSNGSVDPESRKMLLDHLALHGVHEAESRRSSGKSWDLLRRLTSSFDDWEDEE